MAVIEQLLACLDDLTDEEFERFNLFLTHPVLHDLKPIPKAHLDKKKRTDTVNRMIQNYMEEGALKATVTILEKVYRKDLVEKLSKKLPEKQSTSSSTSATPAVPLAAGPSIVAQDRRTISNISDFGKWNITLDKN